MSQERLAAQRLTADELKQRISFPQLIDYYGYKTERSKILCPFHHEKTASFHVYENGGHCYGGCSWSGDIIQFVMDREACYFTKAIDLLSSWFGITKATPVQVATKAKAVPKKIRRDPVNPDIVNCLHGNLKNDKRKWLHEARLITDETIDFLKLGYRPDMDAYSIPFWKGVPGVSEVDVMQFRYAPKEGRRARYISLDSHGFAGLIGRYTINPEFLVVFVGTLDAVLANQDGIPAVSPNGLSVWLKRLDELKWFIGPVKNIYFVPDNTKSETIGSVKLANALGAKICWLPQMESGKDYTDFRLAGHTAKQFLREVIKVSDTPFITDDRHTQTVIDILDEMINNRAEKALVLLEILQLNGYKWYSVNTKLQLLASQQPEGMAGKEWVDFLHKLELAHSYETIAEAITRTAFEVSCRRGEF